MELSEPKILQAFNKYDLDIDDAKVARRTQNILTHKAENDTADVKRLLFNCIDLTTLRTDDSEDSVMALTERVNRFEEEHPELGHVASVCVFPNFAQTVYETLNSEEVGITCVSACFPSSQSFIEVKVAETALACKDGATEIDIVESVGKFLVEDYETVADEISELKEVVGDRTLKVILETGALKTASNIKRASILAMYSGADFIKTSTGKMEPAATPEAALVMCEAIREYYRETGIRIGFKPAGGMKTVDDAITYYTIVKEVLGPEWLTPKYFRLGTSSLANKLLTDILGEETRYF
ncbi:MAG: deoxyribose-phosphate aldolase [Bacteroidaceae bacterium]|nr:deoxyribose-phosphate aldolase [Bacteroidaceae bacterium]